MKLVYTKIFFGQEVAGVQKKIIAQVKNLNDLGLPAVIYSLTGIGDDSQPVPLVKKIIIPGLEYHSPHSIFAKKRRIDIRDSAINTLIETLHADEIIYTRIPYPSRITSKIFKKPRKCKIVIESQSIGTNEAWLNGDYSYVLSDYLYGKDIRTYSDGIVGVTEEITHYELSRCGDQEKPHITIGNGINTDSVSIRRYVPCSEEEIHLLCVANVSQWHGLDRLIRSLGTYHGPTRLTLHIAGEGSEIPRLKNLITKLAISEKVVFHGFSTGKDLDDLFNTCHIAIGSLGLHRIGLTEASILKAREYCACGIPYIIACADPDFSDDFPYILRIPADETPVDLEKVIEFAHRVCKDPDHPQKMRTYAVEYLDWSVKMKRLKAFLETLVDKSP